MRGNGGKWGGGMKKADAHAQLDHTRKRNSEDSDTSLKIVFIVLHDTITCQGTRMFVS